MGDRAASRSSRRFHTPNRAIRDPRRNKHQTYDGNVVLPWPDRGPAIWNPRDPFIIAFREAHPRVEAAWRTGRKLPKWAATAAPAKRKCSKRERKHFDFKSPRRRYEVADGEAANVA